MSSTEIKKQIEDYVEWQCRGKAKVIHSKPEQTYSELGFEITIWNVKTDNDGSWWVAQGDLPMNLYPQDQAYYFATDEVFSFHLGIMLRLMNDEENKPENIIHSIASGTEISINLKRKLVIASQRLQEAVEIEDIQAIGVTCRETLIELINYLFELDDFEGQDDFKKSDVKNRGSLAIDKYLIGSENSDLRKHLRNILNGAWDFSNSITHSSSKTVYEASICLTMTTAAVSVFEDLLNKQHDIVSAIRCKNCGSKRLIVAENDETEDLLIICDNCRHAHIKEEIAAE